MLCTHAEWSLWVTFSRGVRRIVAGSWRGARPRLRTGTKRSLGARWTSFPSRMWSSSARWPTRRRRSAPRSSLETINANDLQPRITAASSRVRRGHLQLSVQLAAPLPERRGRRERRGQRGRQGRGAPPLTASGVCDRARSNGKWLSMPHSIVGNAVPIAGVAQGGRRQPSPETWDEARQGLRSPQRRASRTPDRWATPSATLRPHVTSCGLSAGRDRQDRQKVTTIARAPSSSGSSCRRSEGMRDEGGLAWTTPTQRAFHAGESARR